MIAEATIADIPALCELLAELFAQESDFQPDRTKQVAGLSLILENPQYGKIFVMRRDGTAIGMLNLLHSISLHHGGHALILEDMIVRRDCRGQGIATALLSHAIEYARSLRAVQITLFTDATNRSAIQLYEKLGFARSGTAPMRQSLKKMHHQTRDASSHGHRIRTASALPSKTSHQKLTNLS